VLWLVWDGRTDALPAAQRVLLPAGALSKALVISCLQSRYPNRIFSRWWWWDLAQRSLLCSCL